MNLYRVEGITGTANIRAENKSDARRWGAREMEVASSKADDLQVVFLRKVGRDRQETQLRRMVNDPAWFKKVGR